MDKSEFLLLIPGVIYGIGLADLISISFKKHYFEIYLWAVALFEVLIIQWYGVFDHINVITSNIKDFILMLIIPITFTRSCFILSPSETEDSTTYFFDNRKRFFFSVLVMVIFSTVLHLTALPEDGRNLIRAIEIPLLVIAILWDNRVYRILLVLSIIAYYTSYFILLN